MLDMSAGGEYNSVMNHIFVSRSEDGCFNLAIDEYLLTMIKNEALDGVSLYFFVNKNAVIIGRNQNAWIECDYEKMDADGVQLVRRHTGGGAVYHDGGNLNFSFAADERLYDKDRQNAVVLNALKGLGIEAELSGRNDITVNGMKVSGCAYALNGRARGMHGTLLVSTDMERLSRYLKPSKLKLKAKGISSVRARVLNLSEIADVTVEKVRDAIISEFKKTYGDCAETVSIRSYDDLVRPYGQLEKLYKDRSSWEWRMGSSPVFDAELRGRAAFGEYQLVFNVKNGVIREPKLFTDALDPSIPAEIEDLLNGVRFDRAEMAEALKERGGHAAELAEEIGKEAEDE